MAIRLFAEVQFGVLDFAQGAMRNRLGRFTLGNLQGGKRKRLIFLSPLSAAEFLGFGGYRQFSRMEKQRSVYSARPWMTYITMHSNVVYKVKAPTDGGERQGFYPSLSSWSSASSDRG